MNKQIVFIKNLIEKGEVESLEAAITAIDFEALAVPFVNGDDADMDELHDLIDILKFIEEETTEESVISDETYDKLVEVYQNTTGNSIVGATINVTSNRPMRTHLYPELVGTLGKVHFIYDKDIPEKDSRHSLESWITKVSKVADRLPRIFTMYKYDGLSIVLECIGDTVVNAVTRRDTDDNVGLDVSHIFKYKQVSNIFKHLPKKLTEVDGLDKGYHYGIKIECMMSQYQFDEFSDDLSKSGIKPPKHRRSAVTKIVNTLEESYNPEWFKYLSMPALQISVDRELEFIDDNEKYNWLFVGIINDKYVYFNRGSHVLYDSEPSSIDIFLKNQMNIYEEMQQMAESEGIPIDGAVSTVCDSDIIDIMGRSNSINKFQIAFKFPAGIKKTKLIDVEFPVGPVAGTVTPLAIVEDVTINGCVINHVGLSNYGKLERMNLHKGDEVIVKYDIIPKMYKDYSCVDSDNDVIIGPCDCPICKAPLNIKDGVARCVNPNCDAKLAGKIFNYINKVGIMGIGMNKIIDLVNANALTSIPDLYRLYNFEEAIVNMSGYGQKSYDNMMNAIGSRRLLYPHELMGALGIPDIGRRIMKKICTEITIAELLSDDPSVIDRMSKIKGIGDKMIDKICTGINQNREIIYDLLNYVAIKQYEEDTPNEHVILFTKIRDKDFSKFLEEECNCEIAGSLTKAVDIVIAGGESSKTKTARERGLKVLTLDEAKAMFGYNK